MIVLFYTGLVSTPFIQKVYYTAVIVGEIKFREILKYANSRLLAYLDAYILASILVIPVIIFWFSRFPFDVYTVYEEANIEIFTHSLWLLLLIPLFALYEMALYIMTWDNVSLINAIRASYKFIIRRFENLIIISLISFTISVLSFIPFGVFGSYFISIITNIAIIDVYLQYQRSSQITETF